jgi:tetratricopeptide (TPR) repeat protein
VHPLYLGLCADVVLAARAQGRVLTPDDFPTAPETPDKSRVLINRLLRYVDKEVEVAVHALSACRAFDFELYLKLGQALHFHATHAAFFDILIRFSFVWQAQRRGENWYRIHDLLRRLDDESGNEIARRAHEILEQHYRERGEVAEAIYHANRLDWERGVEEWGRTFEDALRLSRYELCRKLVEVRSELSIESDFGLGRVSTSQGDYFSRLARYREASQEYLEALAAYERELSADSDDIATLTEKGSVLQSLGDLQALLAQYSEALLSYQDSMYAYEQAFNLAPNNVLILDKKGCTLQSWGDLQALLARYSEASLSYQDSINACDQALTLAPDNVGILNKILNNKGNTLAKLGDLQVLEGQYSEAFLSYKDAIDTYTQALNQSQDPVYILNNKANALRSLADLQTRLAAHSQVLPIYKEVIAIYDQSLALAPNDVGILRNKGNALQQMGYLQIELNKYKDALQSYQDAINVYDQVLNLTSNYDVIALNNKARALMGLSLLQMKLLQPQEVLKSMQVGLEAYTRSLEIVPGDEQIQNLRDKLQQKLKHFGKDTSGN